MFWTNLSKFQAFYEILNFNLVILTNLLMEIRPLFGLFSFFRIWPFLDLASLPNPSGCRKRIPSPTFGHSCQINFLENYQNFPKHFGQTAKLNKRRNSEAFDLIDFS